MTDRLPSASALPQPDTPLPVRHRVWILIRRGLMCIAALLVCVGLLLAYWRFRPNASVVAPTLRLEHWVAVGDRMHNSNTDLVFYRDRFYLIHASSPWHFGSERCVLVLWRSPDARAWERVTEMRFPGQDIRDPKFAVMGDRLFLYVLKNADFAAEPYATAVCSTTDGSTWTSLTDVTPEGWLFWSPKSRDGKTWYVPAYWRDHGKSILLRSTDGVKWTQVSVIHEGDRNDETAIEFLPDGRLLATARLEMDDSFFGHPNACTLIATASPPYDTWKSTTCDVTRLDGPCLFSYGGALYAVGRRNPDPRGFLNYYGSILGRKRTSLYRVQEDRLIWLSDLPSAGDTAYAGAVRRGEDLFISYYTSPIDRDYPWILGMLSASDIRIAKVHLPTLAALGNPTTSRRSDGTKGLGP